MAGAKYGAFLGLLFGAAMFAGAAVQSGLMVVLAAQLAIFTVIVWRRTRLPFMTVGGICAVMGTAAGAVVFYRELDVFTWSVPVAFFYGAAAAIPLLLLIESRVHRTEWIRWREHLEHMSLVDLLLARHIPRRLPE